MIRSVLGLIFVLGLATGTFRSVDADVTITGDFPLAVSNGVLVSAQGQPFLLIGDSPQSVIGAAPLCSAGSTFALCTGSTDTLPTNATIVGYLRDRQAHGFNTIMVDLFCDGYIGASSGATCANNGLTPGGVAPFNAQLNGVAGCPEANPPADVACWDLSTPNEAYFTIVDGVIQLASQYGMQVMLVVIETGGSPQRNGTVRQCGTSNWGQTFINNSAVKRTSFANFLGDRYKYPGGTVPSPNLIYQIGNDYQCYQIASPFDNTFFGFMQQLNAADPTHLMTGELAYHASSFLDNTTNNWASIIGLNGVYTYYPSYDESIHAFNQSASKQSASKPAFLIETYYDGDSATGCSGDEPSALRDRKQEWWGLTSGLNAGYIYGNHWVSLFFPGWPSQASHYDTTSATELRYVASFFKSLGWTKLVPDTASALVTAGRNTYANPPVPSGTTANDGGPCASPGLNVGSNTYVSAARANDGTFAVAYVPTSGIIMVNMAQLGPSITATWYDPTAGTFGPPITGSPFPNSALQNFSTPGAHSDGTSDWVLLLQASGAFQQTPSALQR